MRKSHNVTRGSGQLNLFTESSGLHLGYSHQNSPTRPDGDSQVDFSSRISRNKYNLD